MLATIILALALAALAAADLHATREQRRVNASFSARLAQLEAAAPEPVTLRAVANARAQSAGEFVRTVLNREVL